MAGPALSNPTTTIVVAAATVTTSSNTGNLNGTTSQIPMADSIDLWLNCTNNGSTVSGAQLAVYLDVSPDGGTTWFSPLKFASVAGSTGAAVIHFRPTGIGAVEAAAQNWAAGTATGSVGVTQNFVLPPDHRIRYELKNDGLGGSTATFSVWAIASPVGSGRF